MTVTANDDEFETSEDDVFSGNVLDDNSNGVDLGLNIVVTAVNGAAASVGQQITLASGALLTLNADGTFDYDPNGQFEYLANREDRLFPDTFSYEISGVVPGTFAAALELSALDGTTGFTINGVGTGDLSGTSVSSAGDVNADGIDDFLVTAPGGDPGGRSDAGEVYVVFGKTTAFSSTLELSDLDGSNGYKINGIDAGDTISFSAASAGDFNGDGISDLVIGASNADQGTESNAGETYVIYGGSSVGSGGNLNLSGLTAATGLTINGIDAGDLSGSSVSTAGDVNGDGFDDVIIGAPNADPRNENYAGQSFVVFGGTPGAASSVDLSSLDGTNGFVIDGANEYDGLGSSVSNAGDINGDGIDDLIVSSYNAAVSGAAGAGESYVVFGKTSGFGALINASALDGTDGFIINGIDAQDTSGRSVSAAGDVNGDGIDDLIIGATGGDQGADTNAGESYVVFGSTTAFTSSTFNLSSLDGTNGFTLAGIDASDYSGSEVSSAGDVNGDGFDDVLIAATNGDPNGINSGEVYVVFGSASAPSASFDLSTLDGTNGFVINGIAAADRVGQSVSGAGDINGDGFDDLILSSRWVAPNGTDSGQSYVIFGRGSFETDTATVEMEIRGVNDDPIIAAIAQTDVTDSADSTPVTANIGVTYTDVDLTDTTHEAAITSTGTSGVTGGLTLTSTQLEALVSVGTPSTSGGSGTVSLSFSAAGDLFDYLDLNETVTLSYELRIEDGHFSSDTEGFAVVVSGLENEPTLARNDAVSTNESTVLTGSVLADNGSGADEGSTLAVTAVNGITAAVDQQLTLSSGATITLRANGTFDYDPNGAFEEIGLGFTGSDSFNYTIAGTSGSSSTAFVFVAVAGLDTNDLINGSALNDTLDGGVLNDTLFGAAGDDSLTGGSGDDEINGGGDNDTLEGGSGADALNGDDGSDTANYSASDARVAIDLFADTADSGHATGDDLTSIENIIGSDFNDFLQGNGFANTFDGGADIDNMNGRGGDDLLIGGVDDDLLNGGNDNDTLEGGLDNDVMRGNGGDDSIEGGQGMDTAFGGVGNDFISGGTENDSLSGQGNNDTIFGDQGNDTLRGGSGNDSLEGGDDDDELLGQGNNDFLIGGQGNDTLTGAAGADTLDGGIGDDTLTGGNGGDSLDGGIGNDLLNGGANADRLVFGLGNDNDTIAGFQDNIDTIEIAAALAGGQTVAQLLADTSITNQVGGSVVMDFGGGDVLRINNVGVSDLLDDMLIV